MVSLVNLCGRLMPADEARLPVLDHALLYGDGLFETVRLRGRGFFRLAAHLQRLHHGALALELPLPVPLGALERALHETARANGLTEGVLRLTVGRGAGLAAPDAAAGPSWYLVTARPVDPRRPPAGSGLSLNTAGRHPGWCLPAVKSLSYQPFLLARRVARQQGADEALMVAGNVDDPRVEVVEAATASVFCVAGGRLRTPPLTSGCLPGIMRSAVLEVAAAVGLPATEERLSLQVLRRADEIFLASSVMGIAPVTRLDGHQVGNGLPGDVSCFLSRAVEDVISRELAPLKP